jgi:hypothetical protein
MGRPLLPSDLLVAAAAAIADSAGRRLQSEAASAASALLDRSGIHGRISERDLQLLGIHERHDAIRRAAWWKSAAPEEQADAAGVFGPERDLFIQCARDLASSPPREATDAAERLWNLVVSSRCVLDEAGEWSGSAIELAALLKGAASALSTNEKSSIPESSWMGRTLTSCAACIPERVARLKRTSRCCSRWLLRAPTGQQPSSSPNTASEQRALFGKPRSASKQRKLGAGS